jgi:N-acetylmuramic acid 6-phosphate etherase
MKPRDSDAYLHITSTDYSPISMLERLTTEGFLPESANLDELSPLEIVELMNREDAKVAIAVGLQREAIAKAITLITQQLRSGGRLVYVGAGTSGRLGVLDASECPPTFSTSPELVRGIIAGGPSALTNAIEGAEDRTDEAEADLKRFGLTRSDVVMGIATSGRTPYVLAAVRFARELGCATIGFSCNQPSEISSFVDISIDVVVGPEVLAGSTRLKAGTATKMVLNMLTTGTMIQLGKTYGNLMVDLKATNSKLRARAVRLVVTVCKVSHEIAQEALQKANGETKTAIVMLARNVDALHARQLIENASGRLHPILKSGS